MGCRESMRLVLHPPLLYILRIEFPKVQPSNATNKINKRTDIAVEVEVYEHVSACVHKNKFDKIHRKVEFQLLELFKILIV